jgi:hypothetical protein
VSRKWQVSNHDIELLKRKEVEYCIDGYHSFRSVEHSGLLSLLQTCVNFGAKYGKFNIEEVMLKRKAVADETCKMSLLVKESITEALAESK